MKKIALFFALACSVPAMANQVEASQGAVLAVAQAEAGGTVVQLLKTKQSDGRICQEYVSQTKPAPTAEGKTEISKGVLCETTS